MITPKVEFSKYSINILHVATFILRRRLVRGAKNPDAEGVEGMGYVEGNSPSQSTTGSGERRNCCSWVGFNVPLDTV